MPQTDIFDDDDIQEADIEAQMAFLDAFVNETTNTAEISTPISSPLGISQTDTKTNLLAGLQYVRQLIAELQTSEKGERNNADIEARIVRLEAQVRDIQRQLTELLEV